MTLSEDQQEAIDEIMSWFTTSSSRKEYMTMGGFAGCGKTTLIKYIENELPLVNMEIIAFTGKACDVLRRKGIEASTIHSFLYHVKKLPDHKIEFILKEFVPPKLVIVDEASMVPEALFNDLMEIGGNFKVLFIGDHGQLPPIGKKFNLMSSPIIRLEKVHRQAMDSPIIKLANRIRTGKGDITKEEFNGDTGFSYSKTLMGSPRGKKEYEEATQDGFLNHMMICSTNYDRCEYNKRIRSDVFGDFTNKLYSDEKIIILENDRDIGLFNGMMMRVDNYVESDLFYVINSRINISKHAFGIEKPPNTYDMLQRTNNLLYRNMVSADYGYCITCHKAQGSQEETVFVKFSDIDKRIWRDQYRRWLYTAVTRAEKRVYLFESFE